MMKKIVQGLVALAVWFLSTGAAHGLDLTKNIQLDVFALAGGSTMVDAQYWDSAGNLFHSRFEVGPKYTVGVGIPYGKLLTIETEFTGGPNNMATTNTDLNPRHDVVFPIRYYNGSISGVVHAPFSHFHIQPYGAVGIEYDKCNPTSGAVAEALNQGFGAVSTAIMTHNDKFGLNIGGGLDRKLTKRITFRIDLRDHIAGSPAFGLGYRSTPYNLGSYPVLGRANNIEYTAGFVVHIGKL